MRFIEQTVREQGVHRDEFREVLSRLDVLDNEIENVNDRLDRMDERFERMDDNMDRMNDRILSMTRWLIGLLVVFGSMVTVLLGTAQFTG